MVSNETLEKLKKIEPIFSAAQCHHPQRKKMLEKFKEIEAEVRKIIVKEWAEIEDDIRKFYGY